MSLDSFTDSYMEAALWSSNDDDGDPLDSNYDVSDITVATRKQMERDCEEFYSRFKPLFEGQLRHSRGSGGEDASAGHDFWLTRNEHGAGFWDGDWNNGDALTDAAQSFGSFDLLVSRGKLHGYPLKPAPKKRSSRKSKRVSSNKKRTSRSRKRTSRRAR